jgi:hypothetical protein
MANKSDTRKWFFLSFLLVLKIELHMQYNHWISILCTHALPLANFTNRKYFSFKSSGSSQYPGCHCYLTSSAKSLFRLASYCLNKTNLGVLPFFHVILLLMTKHHCLSTFRDLFFCVVQSLFLCLFLEKGNNKKHLRAFYRQSNFFFIINANS